MFQLSPRPIRTLMIATALCGGAATAATPALAKTGGKTAKAAKTTKATTSGKKAVDLVARGLDFEVLSASIDITAEIANVGNARARRAATTIVLSGDAVLDGSDRRLGSVPSNRLKPGASADVSTEVDIPEDLPEGDLYLLVCADGDRIVRERAESNNCAVELLASAEDDVSEDDGGSEDDEDDAVEVEAVVTDDGE